MNKTPGKMICNCHLIDAVIEHQRRGERKETRCSEKDCPERTGGLCIWGVLYDVEQKKITRFQARKKIQSFISRVSEEAYERAVKDILNCEEMKRDYIARTSIEILAQQKGIEL